MFNQEELNQKFPKEETDIKEEPRYVVHWCSISNGKRFLVTVFDKFVTRQVYKADTSDKQKEYKHIRSFYGTKNCVTPKEVQEDFMKFNS